MISDHLEIQDHRELTVSVVHQDKRVKLEKEDLKAPKDHPAYLGLWGPEVLQDPWDSRVTLGK